MRLPLSKFDCFFVPSSLVAGFYIDPLDKGMSRKSWGFMSTQILLPSLWDACSPGCMVTGGEGRATNREELGAGCPEEEVNQKHGAARGLLF